MQVTCMQKKLVNTLDEFHDMHLKNDTLVLADVFGNFRKMFLEIH